MTRLSISIIAAAMMLALLSGCGSSAANTDVKVETPTFVEETAAAETNEAEPADEAPAEMETAKKYIDKDVAELFAAIGEPESSDYAPSCLGSGEDGELYYDGFTVATYREGSSETVKDVF